MDAFSRRLSGLRAKIAKACEAAGRDAGSVRLVAVGKTHPAASLRALHDAGQLDFGENRLQEARAKQEQLAECDICWHFIGPVQSNKTREIAGHFHWVQSVDRERILARLSEQRPEGLPPLNICLQVNIDEEPQKAGLPPDAVAELAALARSAPGVKLRGLMCIPRFTPDPTVQRDSFRRMHSLFEALCADGHELDTLSMGMSADFELAIAEGSTMVRVGTELFGTRGKG